ncbi:MAG: monovalent cation/H+ antiporter complex subunit F [Candidatus Kapabacteria bacterium]|jgi:multicomponent Na+:H+ antiporter subunit F|nr:monovalent cation/H+ antiporter complex subunit F [Candidatus Kapabacteria bacterium]
MSYVEIAIFISIPLIIVSMLIMLYRVAVGPSLEDRVVALDLIATTAIGFVAVYAIISNSTTVIDVGIIIAMLAFLGTTAFAYYLERRSKT